MSIRGGDEVAIRTRGGRLLKRVRGVKVCFGVVVFVVDPSIVVVASAAVVAVVASAAVVTAAASAAAVVVAAASRQFPKIRSDQMRVPSRAL